MAVCSNATCCLCCHGEGYQARVCKRSRSPGSAGPPPRRHRVAAEATFDPKPGHLALAKLRH
jgi:hypothetical protein